MKRKAALLLAGILTCSAAMAGCSGGNQASNEYVTVGGYKGIEVDKVADKEEVTDEDIDSYIASVQQQNAQQVTDRPVQKGDIANIDFVGKMDGQEFDGGSGQGYDLTIGSGQFIDGFEDSIIGHNAGETFDWNGQFPDPYTGNPEFSGKPVTFTITVNSISTLPKVNDDFVKTVSEESSTVDEYREEVKKTLEESAEENYNYSLESEAWNAVLEKAEVEKYPEDEVNEIKDQLVQQYKDAAETYGMSYEDFISSQMNMDVSGFESQAEEAAQQSVKQKYVARAIADEENLTPTDEEYEEHFKDLAETYGFEDVDALKEAATEEELKDMVIQQIVQEWLADNCIQVVSDSAE